MIGCEIIIIELSDDAMIQRCLSYELYCYLILCIKTKKIWKKLADNQIEYERFQCTHVQNTKKVQLLLETLLLPWIRCAFNS